MLTSHACAVYVWPAMDVQGMCGSAVTMHAKAVRSCWPRKHLPGHSQVCLNIPWLAEHPCRSITRAKEGCKRVQ